MIIIILSILALILLTLQIFSVVVSKEADQIYEIEDDIEATMAKMIQSGFDHIDLDVHSLHLQTSAGTYLFDPRDSGDFDDTAAVKDGTSITYTWNVDSVTYGQYIYLGLWAQALTWQRYMRKTPSPAFWEPHEDTVLAYWIDNYEKGVFDDEFPNIANDESTASNLLEALQGMSWDDEGVGSAEKHWQKLRKLAYIYGLKRRSELPSSVEKATDANQTLRHRWVVVRAIIDVKKIVDLFPLMALASEKAVMSLGKLVEGFIPEHVPPVMYGAEVDIRWQSVMNKGKDDVIGTNGTFETSSKYKSYITDFFDYTFLRSSDYDNVVRFAGMQIYVDADALKTARMFCGLGKTTINSENTWFLNLFNVVLESSSGSWDTHLVSGPTKKWFAGINMKAVLNFYDDPLHKQWYEAFHGTNGKSGILSYDHWTGRSLRDMPLDDIVTDIKSATKGTAEPGVYRALMATINYDDSDADRATNLGWFEDSNSPDPTTAVDNSSPYNPLYGPTSTGLRTYHFSWFFLFFVMDTFTNRLLSRDGIGFFVNNWTSSEEEWAYFICLFFGHGSTTQDGDSRPQHYRLQLFPMIDCRRPEAEETLAYATTDTIRVRCLKSFTDWTNYPTFAAKFSTCLLSNSNRLAGTEALFTAPRPKGLDKTKSKRRFNLFFLHNMKNFLMGVIPTSGSTNDSPKASAGDTEEEFPKASKSKAKAKSKSKAKASNELETGKAINEMPDAKPPNEVKDDE